MKTNYRLKLLLSIFLAMATLTSCFTALAATKAYTDVPNKAWFAEAVSYVTENGLFDGTSDSSFNPEMKMTVGMYITVLARAAGIDTKPSDGQKWFDVGMAWAEEHHISAGTNGTAADPATDISRQTAAVLMHAYFADKKIALRPSSSAVAPFSDTADIADWAKTAIEELRVAAVMQGSNGTFNPNNTITRAEAATMLMRMDMIAKGVDPDKKPPVELRDDNVADWFKTTQANYEVDLQSKRFRFEDVFTPDVIAKFDGVLTAENWRTIGDDYIYVKDISDSTVLQKYENGIFFPQKRGVATVTWGAHLNGRDYLTTATVTVTGIDLDEEYTAGITANREWAKQVVADLCKPGMTEREKLVAIANYMCEYMVYSDGNTKADWIIEGDETASGIPMSKRHGGCNNYAERLRAFCYEAGIECHLVGTDAHVWNYVRCNGVWYHVDVSSADMFGGDFQDSDISENSRADNWEIQFGSDIAGQFGEFGYPVAPSWYEITSDFTR